MCRIPLLGSWTFLGGIGLGYPEDVIPPTIVLTPPGGPVDALFTVTATASENVNGLALGSFNVVGGTPSNFQVISPTVYTVDITPNFAEATVTIQIPAGACTDDFGNFNLISNLLSRVQAYYQRISYLTPIAFSRYDELVGVVANELVANRDGGYTGVSLNNSTGPDGSPVPFFDGLGDFVDYDGSGIRPIINGVTGTLLAWFKMANVGVWTDGISRYVWLAYKAGNTIEIRKLTGNNQINFTYTAGGVAESVTVSAYSPTVWVAALMTWDKNAGVDGEVKFYLNNVQQGATQTGLGVWAGPVTYLRSGSSIGSAYHHGWLGPWALWDRVLTANERLAVCTV